jgi:putative transposase
VKFGFVAKHRGIWPVLVICVALGVSRSGFYAWLARPRSQRDLDDELLGREVRRSFSGSDRSYGARRVWHDVLAQGWQCGLHRIERLMRQQALRARPRRRRRPRDQGDISQAAAAPNLLNRQFAVAGPNQKWAADFTYIWAAEGWLYAAVVLDLYSRRVVGWSMQASMTAQLVADALLMAVWRRGRPSELHHSDQAASTPANSSKNC